MKLAAVSVTPDLLTQMAAAFAVLASDPCLPTPLKLQLQLGEGSVFDVIELLSPSGVTKVARFVRDVPVAANEADEQGTLAWRRQF